jgi:hypothetical protein
MYTATVDECKQQASLEDEPGSSRSPQAATRGPRLRARAITGDTDRRNSQRPATIGVRLWVLASLQTPGWVSMGAFQRPKACRARRWHGAWAMSQQRLAKRPHRRGSEHVAAFSGAKHPAAKPGSRQSALACAWVLVVFLLLKRTAATAEAGPCRLLQMCAGCSPGLSSWSTVDADTAH